MTQKLLGNLNISRQNSFGVATASWFGVPIASETVTHNIAQLDEANMRGRYGESPNYEGLTTITGDITFNPHFLELGHFLLAICGRENAIADVGSGVTLHDFSPNPTAGFDNGFAVGVPYMFSFDRDQTLAWQVQDVQVNALEISINAGELVSATASIIGRINSLDVLVTPTYRAPNSIWAFHQASVSLGGAAAVDFTNMVITLNRQIEGIPTLDGSKVISRYEATGPYQARATGSIDIRTQSTWAEFIEQGEAALSINLATEPTSGPNLNIILPQFKYETLPINIDGPGRTISAFTGRGNWDTSSNTSIIYQLTNSQGTSYATF